MATIIEQINALAEAKADIQAAVVEKGGVVSGDTLAGLANDVRAIPQTGDFDWSSIGYTGMPSEMLRGLERARYYKELWDSLDPKPTLKTFFAGDTALSVVPDIDFSSLVNAEHCFVGCRGMFQLPDAVDFSNVSIASYMFDNCSSLQTLPDAVDFSNVSIANNMFYNCSSLQTLPDAVDFSNVSNANNMFYNCSSLQRLWLVIPNATTCMGICFSSPNVSWLRLDGCNVSLGNNAINQCPLSADGVFNLIDSLADRSGQSSLIVQLSAAAKANMSDETRALAASKNWTIA